MQPGASIPDQCLLPDNETATSGQWHAGTECVGRARRRKRGRGTGASTQTASPAPWSLRPGCLNILNAGFQQSTQAIQHLSGGLRWR